MGKIAIYDLCRMGVKVGEIYFNVILVSEASCFHSR